MISGKNPIVRLVKKQPYSEQFFFEQSDTSNLAPSSVRVQAFMLGFSANNLSYCARGDDLHWFDLYPIPKSAPAEFCGTTEYAIAPGWGYATVLESTIPALPVDTILYGMLPTSSMIVDLKLKPSEGAPGHWIETSTHREKVMALYCRYMVATGDFDTNAGEHKTLWKAAMYPVFKSGYLLNKYTFSAYPESPATSPFPALVPWSEAKADLSHSAIITLGSGSKTCRSFVYQMATNRAAGKGPIALMEVTSSTKGTIPTLRASFNHRLVSYKEACTPEVLQQIVDLDVKRIVILDFAGRGDTLEKIIERIQQTHPEIEITLIAIGSGHGKVFSKADIQARGERSKRLNASPMNATDLLDAVMAQIGEALTYDQIHREWEKVMSEQQKANDGTDHENNFLGLSLDVRYGVCGDGVEKVWTELCEGKATGNTACVVKF